MFMAISLKTASIPLTLIGMLNTILSVNPEKVPLNTNSLNKSVFKIPSLSKKS